jgi:hypothetical protein
MQMTVRFMIPCSVNILTQSRFQLEKGIADIGNRIESKGFEPIIGFNIFFHFGLSFKYKQDPFFLPVTFKVFLLKQRLKKRFRLPKKHLSCLDGMGQMGGIALFCELPKPKKTLKIRHKFNVKRGGATKHTLNFLQNDSGLA